MNKSINSKNFLIILMLCIMITGLFGLASVSMTSTQPPIMADQSNDGDISSMAAAEDGTFSEFKDNFKQDIVFVDTYVKPTKYSDRYRLRINASDITLPTNTRFKSWTVRTINTTVATVTTQDLDVVILQDVTLNKAVSVTLNVELEDSATATKLIDKVNKEYDGQITTIGIAVEGANDTDFTYTYVWKKSTVAVDESLITNNTMTVKNAADSGNYTIDVKVVSKDNSIYQETKRLASIPVSIGKKALTLGNFSAISKEYNGTVTLDPSTIIGVESLTLIGVVGGDDVSVQEITNATYVIAKVGDNISMIFIGTLQGTSSDNYVIKSQDETYKGRITKRMVTVEGISAVDREYNGTLDVELDSREAVFGRLIESDKDSLSIINNTHGTIETVNVGNDKPVATDIVLAGDAASNYEISKQPDYITVTITQRKIEITGIVIQSREYDGTKIIKSIINGGLQQSTIATVNGILDEVMVKTVVGEVEDANVGSGKSVTLTVVLEGKDCDNYIFEAGNNNYFARIEPKKLILTNFTVNNKVYDGDTTMTSISDGDMFGVVGFDSISHTIESINATTPNVGSVDVDVKATLDGIGSENYVYVTQKFKATITPRPQRIFFTADAKVYNGYAQTPGYSVEKGPQGENVAAIFLNATAIDVSFNSDGTYKKTIFTVQSVSGNYKLVNQAGEVVTQTHLTIVPRVVTYEWIGVDKVLHSGNGVKVGVKITNLSDVDYDKFGTAEQKPKVFCTVLGGSPSLAGNYTAEVTSVSSTNYILDKAATHKLAYIVHNRALTNTNVTASRPEVQLTSGIVAGDNYGFDPNYNFRIDYRRKLAGNYTALLNGTQSIMLSYQLSFAHRDIAEDMVRDSDKVNISGPVTIKIKMMAEWKNAQDFAMFYTDSNNKSHKVEIGKNAKQMSATSSDNTSYIVEMVDNVEYITITSEKGIIELAVAKFDPNLVPVPMTFWWLIIPGIIILLALIGWLIWYLSVKKKPRSLMFDSSGGYACERLTARCKESIFMPIPVRGTMKFAGWYKSSAYRKMVDYNTMPFWEETLFAKWIDNNGEVQKYLPLEKKRVKEISQNNKAVRSSKRAVSLMFNTRGGNPIDTITADINSAVLLPTPAKYNDNFLGWYSDAALNHEANFDAMPQQSKLLFAKWESDKDSNPTPPIQTKSMYGDYSESSTYGTEYATTKTKAKEEEITSRPVTNIVGSNDKIAKNSDERAAEAFISSRIAEAAAATRGVSVNFIARGGEELRAITAAAGENIALPQASKEGSTFLGWYSDVNLTKEVNLAKMPTSDTILYAKWAEDATVQEMYDKGIIYKAKEEISSIPVTNNVESNDKTAKNSIERAFVPVVSSIAATAVPKKGKPVNFVTFGGAEIETIIAAVGEKVTLPVAVKNGSTFLGWYRDSKFTKEVNLAKLSKKETTLYAKWAEDATVQEMYDKGIIYKAKEEIASIPVTNNVEGNDKTAKNSIERVFVPVVSPIAATAVPKKGKPVNFVTRGGAEIETIIAAVGEKVRLPEAIKEGSTFLGWYRDSKLTKEVNLAKLPKKETTLYAKWAEDATVQEMYDKGIVNDDEINKGKMHVQQEQQHIDNIMTQAEIGSVVERSVPAMSKVEMPNPVMYNPVVPNVAVPKVEMPNPVMYNHVEPNVTAPKAEMPNPVMYNHVVPDVAVPKVEMPNPVMYNHVETNVTAPKAEMPNPVMYNHVEPNVAVPKAEMPNPVMYNHVEPNVTAPKAEMPNPVMYNHVEPNVAAPKAEMPNSVMPKVAAPKVDTPNHVMPNVATPKVATPTVAAPKVATPKVATPTVAAPKVATGRTADVKNGKMYSIEFNCLGGEPISPLEARKNEKIGLPNAIKPDARFVGWFYDKQCNDKAILTTMPNKNIRLFAKWDK